MTEENDLRSRLVIGQKRDGRREYDDEVRDELVRLCPKRGVSIARTPDAAGPARQGTAAARHQHARRSECVRACIHGALQRAFREAAAQYLRCASAAAR